MYEAESAEIEEQQAGNGSLRHGEREICMTLHSSYVSEVPPVLRNGYWVLLAIFTCRVWG